MFARYFDQIPLIINIILSVHLYIFPFIKFTTNFNVSAKFHLNQINLIYYYLVNPIVLFVYCKYFVLF